MHDPNQKLTPHFTLGELAGLGDARYRAAQLEGLGAMPAHGPRQSVAQRLEALAQQLLEPVRAHVGRPVRINSGYRSPEKNAATRGSSPTSQHLYGEAADISVPGLSDGDLRVLFDWIAYHSKLTYGQVIYEDARPLTEGGAWIHLSLGSPYRAAGRCNQRWTWTPAAGYKRLP
jgi:hypothetical protein